MQGYDLESSKLAVWRIPFGFDFSPMGGREMSFSFSIPVQPIRLLPMLAALFALKLS